MNRPLRPKMLLAFLLLAAVPAAALAQKPPAALSQKQTLAQDARLDRVVSLDVISVPLVEVLQQQSLDKSTEKMEDGHRFLLTAAPDCADLKLQVRLNARPLRTLMTALAEMLPGTWTATPHDYQLSMTIEAAAARTEWWRLFLGERAKALAAQRQAVFDAMQTKARRRKDSDPDPEQSDRAVEADIANQHDFFHSLPPALKEQIAANMDETPSYELSGGGYGSGGEKIGTVGWLSQMPPQAQDRFKDAMQANVDRLASAPPPLQHYATEAKKDLAAFDPSRVYFLFQNWGMGVMATPFNGPPSVSGILDLNVQEILSTPVLMLSQTELADVVYGREEMMTPGWKHMADGVRKQGAAAPQWLQLMADDVYGMGEAAPVEWRQLAAYRRARVWPNILPKLPRVDGSLRQAVVSRAAQTDWLGEKGHLEYVSDYYCDYITHGGYAMPEAQKKRPVTRPLAAELNELAAKRDVSWRKDADGITLIRNNRWYRDDGLEVPQPLLRRWFGRFLQARRQDIDWEAARAAFREAAGRHIARPTPLLPQSPEERIATRKQTWDWAAEVFSTLTPWQVYNGLALFQPEERDLAAQNEAASKLFTSVGLIVPQTGGSSGRSIVNFDTQRPPFNDAISALKGLPHMVQFYTNLGDGERTALLGGRLPVSALGAAQVSQAVSLQPLLPQALQALPAPSVFLGLLSRGRSDDRAFFGGFPWMGLEVVTAPSPAP